MSESQEPCRFHTRSDIREVQISEQREEKLRQAFEETVPHERISQCVAASFEVDGELNDSGVILSSWLHHERIFDLVGSFGGGEPETETEVYANATVVDQDSGEHLAAHVSKERILISRKHEDVSFEAFRDYILFLENQLHVSLTPV